MRRACSWTMRRTVLLVVVGGALAGPLPAQSAGDTLLAAHLLRRATYGPRPGDLDAVLRQGWRVWLERQLRPETIVDTAWERTLARLPDPMRRAVDVVDGRTWRRMAADDSAARRVVVRQAVRQRLLAARDVATVKLLRAVLSERQLEAVMTDFWANHFHVFVRKGPVAFLLRDYEERAIRPHVFSRFEDMLRAVAQHPAMVLYLDNARSAAPNAAAPGRRAPRGLNENYARELLELHTLGVDGGYTQADVIAVARALTGWTVGRDPDGQFVFRFRPDWHDDGPKVVLGQPLRGRGLDEGLELLHRLATHPSTARHLARKLAQRFVADDPPPALVERLATTFLRTGGDLRAVTWALFASPEFQAAAATSAKVKSPFQYVVSALRATGAEVRRPEALLRTLRDMGEFPFGAAAPNGYPLTSAEWVHSAALAQRIAWAEALAAGRVPGVRLPPLDESVAALAAALLPGRDVKPLLAALPPEARAGGPRALGLLLASPEFQRF